MLVFKTGDDLSPGGVVYSTRAKDLIASAIILGSGLADKVDCGVSVVDFFLYLFTSFSSFRDWME